MREVVTLGRTSKDLHRRFLENDVIWKRIFQKVHLYSSHNFPDISWRMKTYFMGYPFQYLTPECDQISLRSAKIRGHFFEPRSEGKFQFGRPSNHLTIF